MQIKICLGIQLRVFGVKSFFTLKMSRSLKMLLPVSHGFIKDWSMEMRRFSSSHRMSERLFTRPMQSKVWILPTESSTVREAYFQVIQHFWKPCIWLLSKPLKNGLWAFGTGDRSTVSSALCMREDSRNNRICMHDEKDVFDVRSWHARNHVVYINQELEAPI